MSHVTSAGCCLTPDDTTKAQSTTPSPAIIINMPRDGAGKREGGDGQGENANKLINRSKERQIERVIAKKRRCRSLMSPLIRSTMKWRCLVFMFYHRSRPPEQTRGNSQT